MAKPVQPAVLPENGRGEQPDERDNEIVIELDRENQYGRTQPRANEPQGNHLRNIQMVHPHLVSRHIFFRFFCSFVSITHVPFPTLLSDHPTSRRIYIHTHICTLASTHVTDTRLWRPFFFPRFFSPFFFFKLVLSFVIRYSVAALLVYICLTYTVCPNFVHRTHPVVCN